MMKLFSNRIVSEKFAADFIEYFTKGDNWHKMDKNTGNLGYGWVHYGLIRMLQPEKVLCVGSRYGYIPAVCAMACRDNAYGKVDFVDAGFDMDDYDKVAGEHWGGVGFWKKCDPKKYFGKFGLADYIDLYVERSVDYWKKHNNSDYGYVYLDGDHSYKGVLADFEMFWPKVSVNGFLSLHDITSQDKDGNVYGTRKFWAELKKKYQIAMEFKEDPGLGIVQKT